MEQSGSTLLVRGYMTYMSSNMLRHVHQYKSADGHLWMYISEGTEKWLPAQNRNKDVADTGIRIKL